MAEPKPRRATYADVLAAPEHEIAEILDGELVVSRRPGGPHTSVASGILGELYAPFDRGRGGGPGGWIILVEPELHLDEDILVPDIAGWRRSRLPSVPDAAYFTLAPDWICEVLSPSTEKIDRARKLRIYARAGVGHAWLVHPRLRTLEVLRLHDGHWLTLAVHLDDDVIRAEPFAELELSLASLWQDLPTRASEPAGEYATM